MKDKKKLEEVHGELLDITSPSGYNFTLRMQTGDDDDILSSSRDAVDGTSINKFIAAIVVNTDFTEKGKLTLSNVLDMKLSDKYALIVASRIFSIGQILKFEYQWEGTKNPMPYEEDLGLYIWEYDKDPFPLNPGDPDYYKYRIKPHKHGKETFREITLESGKIVRYTFMNGRGEKFLMGLSLDEQSKNKELIARDIHLKVKETWVKVQNFKSFTARDMMEIRRDVFEVHDPILELATDLENPQTGEVLQYPIVGTNDFFYPREV